MEMLRSGNVRAMVVSRIFWLRLNVELMFMPMDQSLYEDSYRFVVHEILDQQVDYLESQYDDVYLNLEAGNNDTTIEMLDRAEVVVVCLPANAESFDEFYDRYRSLVGKCYFVFFGSGGTSETMKKHFLQYLPTYAERSCYLVMTRLLKNYLSDGRGLDYLDRCLERENQSEVIADVAEEAGQYRAASMEEQRDYIPKFRVISSENRSTTPFLSESSDEYTTGKNETDRRISDEALVAMEYGMPRAGQTEQETIRGIRRIGDWLIRYEHREIGSDCDTIIEHMLRRKYIPREVLEWRAAHLRKGEPVKEKQ